MTIFNKPLSDYVAFCRPFLILIPVVGLIKLALSLGGASNSTTWWVSMTAVTWIAILYCATRIHTTGFGSYRELLVICVLLNLSAQVISILGILIGIFTDKDNVYVFALGEHERTWWHVAMHLFFGTTVGSLLAWLGGALILAITRKVTGASRRASRLSA
jgi:hypothetical protein